MCFFYFMSSFPKSFMELFGKFLLAVHMAINHAVVQIYVINAANVISFASVCGMLD